MIGILKSILKVAVFAVLLTAFGQIPVREVTLENRYHELVNSDAFQQNFSKLSRPVTWTGEKLKELLAEARKQAAEVRSR